MSSAEPVSHAGFRSFSAIATSEPRPLNGPALRRSSNCSSALIAHVATSAILRTVKLSFFNVPDEAATAHTTNPVPLIYVSTENAVGLKDGRLCDLAPTILKVMDFTVPAEMTGKPLVVSDEGV